MLYMYMIYDICACNSFTYSICIFNCHAILCAYDLFIWNHTIQSNSFTCIQSIFMCISFLNMWCIFGATTNCANFGTGFDFSNLILLNYILQLNFIPFVNKLFRYNIHEIIWLRLRCKFNKTFCMTWACVVVLFLLLTKKNWPKFLPEKIASFTPDFLWSKISVWVNDKFFWGGNLGQLSLVGTKNKTKLLLNTQEEEKYRKNISSTYTLYTEWQ